MLLPHPFLKEWHTFDLSKWTHLSTPNRYQDLCTLSNFHHKENIDFSWDNILESMHCISWNYCRKDSFQNIHCSDYLFWKFLLSISYNLLDWCTADNFLCIENIISKKERTQQGKVCIHLDSDILCISLGKLCIHRRAESNLRCISNKTHYSNRK